MALVYGVRSRAGGARRSAALGHIGLFHSSAPLREKWRSKYKNKTGYTDPDNGHKKYVAYERRKERASHRRSLLDWRLHVTFNEIEGSYYKSSQHMDRRWNRKSDSSKKTNEWEAYLKYEGDWERFCRKFTSNLPDFDTRPRHKGRGKKMWTEWYASDDLDDDEDEDEDDDDGWDDDPTFSSRYRKPRVRVHSTQQQSKTVVTVGQRSDRLALGLPPAGSLTMEELKAAFRASALKWHPDRHQGSSKDTAEEKFKACGNAYRALCSALAESNNRC